MLKSLKQLVSPKSWGKWPLIALLGLASPTFAADEQVLPELRVGSKVYTNVTVTTKTKNYVFILHSEGMTNVKVAELAPEVRELLGYQVEKPKTNTIAMQAMAKVESPEVKKVEQELSATLSKISPAPVNVKFNLPFLIGTLVFLVCLYVFWCVVLAMICDKAHQPAGFLIWIPVLQLFPLLKAAGMSGWWFLAFLIPGLNLIAHILWCVKIAEARNKTFLTALLLILPVTNLFAMLYLAFSGVAPRRPKPSKLQIRTVEPATA